MKVQFFHAALTKHILSFTFQSATIIFMMSKKYRLENIILVQFHVIARKIPSDSMIIKKYKIPLKTIIHYFPDLFFPVTLSFFPKIGLLLIFLIILRKLLAWLSPKLFSCAIT